MLYFSFKTKSKVVCTSLLLKVKSLREEASLPSSQSVCKEVSKCTWGIDHY